MIFTIFYGSYFHCFFRNDFRTRSIWTRISSSRFVKWESIKNQFIQLKTFLMFVQSFFVMFGKSFFVLIYAWNGRQQDFIEWSIRALRTLRNDPIMMRTFVIKTRFNSIINWNESAIRVNKLKTRICVFCVAYRPSFCPATSLKRSVMSCCWFCASLSSPCIVSTFCDSESTCDCRRVSLAIFSRSNSVRRFSNSVWRNDWSWRNEEKIVDKWKIKGKIVEEWRGDHEKMKEKS